MDDALLKRADSAIKESHRIRDAARDGVMRAKIVAARISGTRQCMCAETARSRRIQLRMAGEARAQKSPEYYSALSAKDQSGIEQTSGPTDPSDSAATRD